MLRRPDAPPPSPGVRLPRADDDTKEAVLDVLDAMRDALPELRATLSDRFVVLVAGLDIPRHGEALAMSIPLLETCLDCEPNEVGPELLAQLALFSLLPALPEQLALQIAFGWSIAHEHAGELAPMLAREGGGGITIGGYLAALDPTGDASEIRAGRWFRGDAGREPDRERVTRGIALFRRIAAHLPDGMRASVLCVVAWLFWAIGKRPHALAHLAGVSPTQPSGALVHALAEHIATHVPKWMQTDGRDVRPISRGKL